MSRYTPHQGAKERERAKRCYLSFYLNERAIDAAIADCDDGNPTIVFHDRAIPTICQQSKKQWERSNRLAKLTDEGL